jgi:exodeoxyribonuclease V gamma subunit
VTAPPTGIVVYRASRLEALLEPFARLREAELALDPLRPTRVIAAHPGMQRWLVGALARRAGTGGVVANLDLRLPSLWIDDLARRVLGEGALALAPYRREALRWCIVDAFARADLPALAPWLAAAHEPRQRLALADRVAGLYAQYLVYRPDWLLAWQAGRFEVPDARDPTPLAPLWRQLRDAIGQPHRAERMARLLSMLRDDPARAGEPGVLHVFGVSHLPKPVLDALRLVSRGTLVAIHMPDPCVQHWAGLRNEREVIARFGGLGLSEDAERAYGDLGHPLLAAFGRMGQHFGLVLNEGEEGVVSDTRHWADLAPRGDDARTLLGRVQESIRQLRPSCVEAPEGGAVPLAAREDSSLRVHACHTRLRELEVLRESLLDALAADPTLEPRDIVVMAPAIDDYLPLAPAVFGPPNTTRGSLPWHAADVGLARTHPVFEAALALLELPDSRVTAPDVAGLLGLDPVARALDLDADARDALLRWLGRARVAWGLDGAARAAFDVPPIDAHTFAWGLSRMIAGFVHGDDRAGCELPPPGLLPVDGIGAAGAAALGALDRLLVAVDALRREAGERRPASTWFARVQSLFDGYIVVDPDDRAADEANALLHRHLQALRREVADAGCDPPIDFACARDAVRARLDADAGRAPFLPGGIAFCGMVPQRAVPYRVIAVLGLDDGAFPRARGDGGLDPMARHPRLGDRDPRSDDRYLFLETLMAARERLHLSFVGEGAHDGKARAPAAPLAELLAFLDARHGLDALDLRTERPWRIHHPLQPFDRRYFVDDDPRLVSRDRVLAAALDAPPKPETPLVSEAGGTDLDAASPLVSLRALRDYYRDPARHLLVDVLGLRLDALDDEALSDAEPLDAEVSRLERAEQQLVGDALDAGANVPDAPPAWLAEGGVLPPGRSGERAWSALREAAVTLLRRARELLGANHAPAATVSIDIGLAGLRVVGELPGVRRGADGSWCVIDLARAKAKSAELRTRAPLFVAFAALALARPDDAVHVLRMVTGQEAAVVDLSCAAHDATARVELGRRLAALASAWDAARRQPTLFLPALAEAAAEAGDDADAAHAVAQAWSGRWDGGGEATRMPGYGRLYGRGRGFEEPVAADVARLRELGAAVAALVDWPGTTPA